MELGNHLGNVLTTISDRKIGVYSGSSLNLPGGFTVPLVNSYEAEKLAGYDYFPFGMMSRTTGASANYRFGFQGTENDFEIKGWQNQFDFGFRAYDPRIGRFLSIDPLYKKYPQYSPYHFSSNQPIHARELEGLESEFDLTIPNSPDEVDLNHWKLNTEHKAPNSIQWKDVHGNLLTFDKGQPDASKNSFAADDHWHFERPDGKRLTAEGVPAKGNGHKKAHLYGGTQTKIKIQSSVTTTVVDGVAETKTVTKPSVVKDINGKLGTMSVAMSLVTTAVGIVSGDPDSWFNAFGRAEVGELKAGHLSPGFGNYYTILREETKEWTENGVKHKTVTRYGQNYLNKGKLNGKFVGVNPVGSEFSQTQSYINGKPQKTSQMREQLEMN